MKVTTPKIYNLFNAPEKLKKKFIDDVSKHFEENLDAKKDKNLYIHLQLLIKQLSKSTCDTNTIKALKQQIQHLDRVRNINITNFLPEFNNYL